MREFESPLEVIKDFPARKVNRDKYCEACGLGFKTQIDAAKHVVDEHNPIHIEQWGDFSWELHAHMPYFKGQRTLNIWPKALYQGVEIDSSRDFVNGAIWMFQKLNIA